MTVTSNILNYLEPERLFEIYLPDVKPNKKRRAMPGANSYFALIKLADICGSCFFSLPLSFAVTASLRSGL